MPLIAAIRGNVQARLRFSWHILYVCVSRRLLSALLQPCPNPPQQTSCPSLESSLRSYYAAGYEVPALDGAFFSSSAMMLSMSILQIQSQAASAPAIVASLTRPNATKIGRDHVPLCRPAAVRASERSCG